MARTLTCDRTLNPCMRPELIECTGSTYSFTSAGTSVFPIRGERGRSRWIEWITGWRFDRREKKQPQRDWKKFAHEVPKSMIRHINNQKRGEKKKQTVRQKAKDRRTEPSRLIMHKCNSAIRGKKRNALSSPWYSWENKINRAWLSIPDQSTDVSQPLQSDSEVQPEHEEPNELHVITWTNYSHANILWSLPGCNIFNSADRIQNTFAWFILTNEGHYIMHSTRLADYGRGPQLARSKCNV